MHDRSYRWMRRRAFAFAIPIIVVNIITSSANFGLKQFVNEADQRYVDFVAGSFNLLSAILAAVEKL